jgi:hypothetical protein
MAGPIEAPKPPRWVRALVITALTGVCLLAVAVTWMAYRTWPWPTVGVAAVPVALAAGYVAGRRQQPDLELIQSRKDTAIEACLDTAFELQRVTGEVPAVADDTGIGTVRHLLGQQRPYDQAGERPLCAWSLDGGCWGAVTRIDLPGASDIPACRAHVAAARVGDVALADAIPDRATYQARLG